MPDNTNERTEPPTQRRRDEARESGQIAKSQDLGAALSLLAGMIALGVMGQGMLRKLLAGLGYFLGRSEPVPLTSDQMKVLARMAAGVLGEVVLPIMIVLILVSIVVALAQTGLLFTFKPLKPDLNKLNPLSGAKRLVSGRAFMRMAMSILKLIIVTGVAYLTISDQLNQIVFGINLEHWTLFGSAASLVFDLAIRLGIILLILGILDFAYQRYKHEEDLKMTKEEVKEEMRRMEGDPIVKQRQRRVQQEIAMQRIRSEVPKADVVVTNPTELAIAIQYDPDSMGAPRVLAKGKDFMAVQIRKIAIEHGVPIVERKPLAQALYRSVEVGDEIPPQFYKAVAEILAYVYELTGRSPATRQPAGVGV